MDVEEPDRDETQVFMKRLQNFVVVHDAAVGDMVKTMGTSTGSRKSAQKTSNWNAFTDTVTIDMSNAFVTDSIAETLGTPALQNAPFHRTVVVLVSTKIEMRALITEARETLIPPLQLYGDVDATEGMIKDEDSTRGFGRLMPHLMDLWNWHQRVCKVIQTTTQQFGSLYDEAHEHDKFAPYQRVRFSQVWLTFFELIGAVVEVEEVVSQHEILHRALTTYRRMMENVKKNPTRFEEANTDYLEQFGKLLNKVQRDLLSLEMFKAVTHQQYDTPEVNVSVNGSLFQHATRELTGLLQSLKRAAGTPNEGANRSRVIALYASFVWYSHLFNSRLILMPAQYQDFSAQVYALHRNYAVIPIVGTTHFKAGHWLARAMPSVVKRLSQDPIMESAQSIQQECDRLARAFNGLTRKMYLAVTSWVAEMQSTMPNERSQQKQNLTRVSLLLRRGIAFAQELQRMMHMVLAAHESADIPVRRDIILSVFIAVQILSTIRQTVHQKTAWFASSATILVDFLTFGMKKTLYDVYYRLTSQLQEGAVDGVPLRAAVAEIKTDQQCALSQALYLLSKPLTQQAIQCLDVVLSIAFSRDESGLPITPDNAQELFRTFIVVREFCEYQKLISDFTSCEFMYWHRDSLLPIFISAFHKNPQHCDGLRHLFYVLHDCVPMLLTAKHIDSPHSLVTKYDTHVRGLIRTRLVEKLVIEIEEELRLQAHAVVLGESYRPHEGTIRKLSNFSRMAPCRLFGSWIHVKSLMEDVLDQRFYNLNALNPNDWATYEHMRMLAAERYKLNIAEGYLPGSIVDQGLDVLTVTKNIHFFVANFTYNLNEQMFLQRPTVTESKYLSSLHIRHISNSIRTHGTGIMNTTVNYVYKCLLKKLSVVSQFLFDDHIKSKLMREIKWFNSRKAELSGRYPVSRVEKFIQEIRKLGVSDDERTYLDQVRQLVAEIGNALGYMRMVRSGGMRSLHQAAACIDIESMPFLMNILNPNILPEGHELDDEDEEIEEKDFVEQVSEKTAESVDVVDKVVGNMTKRLASGSDYFRLLEEGISRKLMNADKYGHLKNFYMIIPAMTMSFTEMMIREKERLINKNKEGIFCDDGFALGCVFLNSLFRCEDKFDGLHWFDSIIEYYDIKKQQAEEALHKYHAEKRKKKAKKDQEIARRVAEWRANKKNKGKPMPASVTNLGEEEDQDEDEWALGTAQTTQLNLTMMENAHTEQTLLHWSFNGCRVFFKHRDPLNFESSSDDDEAAAEED